MTWRVTWGGAVIGTAATKAAAQALAGPDSFHALATCVETGERWILRPAGWEQTVRAPKAAADRQPEPEEKPKRGYRADIDG